MEFLGRSPGSCLGLGLVHASVNFLKSFIRESSKSVLRWTTAQHSPLCSSYFCLPQLCSRRHLQVGWQFVLRKDCHAKHGGRFHLSEAYCTSRHAVLWYQCCVSSANRAKGRLLGRQS